MGRVALEPDRRRDAGREGSVTVVRNAVWVTGDPPDRRLSGSNIRQAHLLEALGRTLPVDVLSCGELDPQTRRAVRHVSDVPGAVRQRTSGRVLRRLETLYVALGGGPEEVWGAAEQRRHLGRALGRGDGYDLVCVEHAAFAPLLPRGPRSNRWAITLHNVASARGQQQRAVTRGRRQRWALQQEVRQARELEAWTLRSYDVTVVVSELDASLLPGPSLVVPNGVDTSRFPPVPLPSAPTVVFLGALMTPPNVDAATWFVNEIWPGIRASVPEATVELVGRDPTPEVLALADHAGVRVVANPPDVVDHLLRARLVVVPLRIGSGTRLKALEGMAARRPVVGTTIGLEGLDVRDGRDVVVADDAADFATSVVRLLTDDAESVRIASSGRALVEAQYDWDMVGRRYVEGLLGPQPASP